MTDTSHDNIIWSPYFKLLSFLITSARGCVDEPHIYGPLRLIDAAQRLIDIMKQEGIYIEDLDRIKEKIEKGIYLVMFDENRFINLLDELTADIASIIKKGLTGKQAIKHKSLENH